MIHQDFFDDNFAESRLGQSQSLIKSLFTLTETIKLFEPSINGRDQDWEFHLKVNRKWQVLNVKLYNDTWYCNLTPGLSNSLYGREKNNFCFSLLPTESHSEDLNIPDVVAQQLPLMNAALQGIYIEVKEDPIKYHSQLLKLIPPSLKWGVAPSSLIQKALPEWRSFESDLRPADIQTICELCQESSPEPITEMTAQLFFDYCKIAYLANPTTFEKTNTPLNQSASGHDLYRTYADGRDAGLSKIKAHSSKLFSEWYDNQKRIGSHPWEIYRGGNSTHIDLRVEKTRQPYKQGWQVTLSAFSSSRLVETARIALALNSANMPFELEYKESYLQRLRGEDMVGIIPDGFDLAYGWHNFPKEFKVADSIHWSWLKESSKEAPALIKNLKSATTWLPIRPLRLTKDPI
jgi:hypothetical protein